VAEPLSATVGAKRVGELRDREDALLVGRHEFCLLQACHQTEIVDGDCSLTACVSETASGAVPV